MGSAELAYNLKDYYRYMGGSEELGRAGTLYSSILNTLNSDVANNASDRTIATNYVKEYTKITYFQGFTPLGMEASMAVFSSADMENTYDKINALSRGLTDILSSDAYSAEMRNDVFKAIRKASLSCYVLSEGNAQEVDLGEFLSFLQTNIDALNSDYSKYTDDDVAKLKSISSSLDQVLNSGFLVYLSIQNLQGLGSLKKEATDGVISLNYSIDESTSLWTDARTGTTGKRDYIYGSSIVMPVGFDLNVDEFRKSPLYSYYSDSPLKDYVSFLDAYYRYYGAEGGYKESINNLAGELAQQSIYNKLIKQVDGNSGYTNTIEDNGKKLTYITLKVADSYEEVGLTAPAHSTGSPMLDIMETQRAIQVAAVHKEYFYAPGDNDNPDKYLVVDMICAEQPLSKYSYALGSNTIILDVTAVSQSITEALALQGSTFDLDRENPVGSYDWQFVLKSDLESKPDSKASAISVILNESESIYPDTVLTISGGYVTAQTKTNEDTGEPQTSYNLSENAYHLFIKKEGENEYMYRGTVELSENNQYTLVNDVVGISAYHYVLGKTLDQNNDTILYKQQLEGLEGIKSSYFALPTISGNSLSISQTSVSERLPAAEGQEPVTTATRTGYVLDMWGNGAEYTSIAYPESEKIYESGESIGNGPLNIEQSKILQEQLSLIGMLVNSKADYEGYTNTPIPDEDEELPPYAVTLTTEMPAADIVFNTEIAADVPSVDEAVIAQTAQTANEALFAQYSDIVGELPIAQNSWNDSAALFTQNSEDGDAAMIMQNSEDDSTAGNVQDILNAVEAGN